MDNTLEKRKKILSELLVIRHPDTYPEISGITGQPAVSKPDIVPHPDGGIQIAEFFHQANQRAQEKYANYLPKYKNGPRHIDRAFSSPRVRAVLSWLDIFPFVDGITNTNRRFRSQQAIDRWASDRFLTKLEQEGMASWRADIENVRRKKEPWDIYAAFLIFDEEIRREQLAMLTGIRVDDRLKDVGESDVVHAGMNRKMYERLVLAHRITATDYFNLLNFLNDALAPDSRAAHPTLAVAVTHGVDAIILESLVKYKGREEKITDRTYGELKQDIGSIPHGSGLQIFCYEDGTREVERIYVSTHSLREKGVQPSSPACLNIENTNEFWRE